MATFWVRRVGDTLQPADTESACELGALPFGKDLRAELKQPRNMRFHRLFWVLCSKIAAATDLDRGVVADMLKIASGHCHVIHSKKYGTLHLPRSISWAKLDQSEFNVFFEGCVKAIYSEFGIARPDVLALVGDLLEPKAVVND